MLYDAITDAFGMFDDKVVFLTGGSGSWGQEFIRQLLKNSKVREIRVYSRGEYQQSLVRSEYREEPRLKFIIGDVRDMGRVTSTMRGSDYVIHLAALKHVPVVEEHVTEAIATNILGTQNVMQAAMNNNVVKFLFVSSDKAVDPLNFYGVTKLAGERLTVASNDVVNSNTIFVCYRGGNVLGSNGSVIPVFKSQIETKGEIVVTDETMTRFFMSVSDIVRRALLAMHEGVGGEIFVPVMKAATLATLIKGMINIHAKGKAVKKKVIGVRPGEKHTELLISRNEAYRTREFGDLWVIMRAPATPEQMAKYGKLKAVQFSEFGSADADQFTVSEFEQLLRAEEQKFPQDIYKGAV